jgi:hypothetical protein
MGPASIVTTIRYIHATDQGKRGAIVVLSEYQQKRRHKLVTLKTAGPRFIGTCRLHLINGEPWRARTSDPLIKSQLLYQLS